MAAIYPARELSYARELNQPAWIRLIQRRCAYFGGIALSAEVIATQAARLYPEEEDRHALNRPG